MRKSFAVMGLAAAILAGVGCTSSARFVEQHKDWGIVAVQSQQEEEKAKAFIRQHHGDNFVIVESYDPKGPRPGVFDPQSGQFTTTQPSGSGWYVKYALRGSSLAQLPGGVPNGPLPPGGFPNGPLPPGGRQLPPEGLPNGQPIASTGGLPTPNLSGIQPVDHRQPKNGVGQAVTTGTLPQGSQSTRSGGYNPYGGSQ